MGPGWPTPYNLIVVNPRGPITTAATLEALDQLQEQIARGPSRRRHRPRRIQRAEQAAGQAPQSLEESGKLITGGKAGLKRLVNGLGQAGSGATQLQSGLGSASTGAGKLHSGSGSAQSGAAQLHGARLRAQRLGEAVRGPEPGAGRRRALKNGATQALAGSIELTNGLGSAHTPVSASLPSLKQLAGLTASTSSALSSLQGQAQSAAGDLASATERCTA